MSPQTLTLLLVFSIPILAIVGGFVKDYLEFKATHQGLGADTEALESELASVRERLDAAEEERDALVRRVQNLETIVTSDVWDALPDADPNASSITDPDALEAPFDIDDAPSDPDAPSDADRADDLARRLRSR